MQRWLTNGVAGRTTVLSCSIKKSEVRTKGRVRCVMLQLEEKGIEIEHCVPSHAWTITRRHTPLCTKQ
jgi:hypothetical protein